MFFEIQNPLDIMNLKVEYKSLTNKIDKTTTIHITMKSPNNGDNTSLPALPDSLTLGNNNRSLASMESKANNTLNFNKITSQPEPENEGKITEMTKMGAFNG